MSSNDNIIAKIKTAASQVEKIQDFPLDSEYAFNFLNATKVAVGDGGYLVPAFSATFPALLTGSGAMVLGVLGPCGLNTPHTHPRAMELQIVVEGGPIMTGTIMENGARVVNNTVNLGSMTIFQQGSMHFQQNMGCTPTVFVSSFNYDDPGTGQSAQELFSLDKDVIVATLGDTGAKIFDNLRIPASVAKGSQQCFDRCGIDRRSFNFSASFGDFVPFSNSTVTVPLPASVSSSVMGKQTSGALAAANVDQGSTNNLPFDQNPLSPTVIGLSVVSAALGMACLGMVLILWRRRKTTWMYTPPAPITAYTYTTPYDDTETLTSKHTLEPAKA